MSRRRATSEAFPLLSDAGNESRISEESTPIRNYIYSNYGRRPWARFATRIVFRLGRSGARRLGRLEA